MLRSDGVHLRFHTSFGLRELEEWNDLMNMIGEIKITDYDDVGLWALNC